MKSYNLIIFALIAAIGNAMFAAGQKKATVSNSLFFIAFSVIFAISFLFVFIIFLPKGENPITLFKENWPMMVLSGAGLCLTYIGFNLLYKNFGASSYVYYAVLSIITTSVIVGAIIFRETLNAYHIAAIVFSLVAVFLYSVGNNAV